MNFALNTILTNFLAFRRSIDRLALRKTNEELNQITLSQRIKQIQVSWNRDYVLTDQIRRVNDLLSKEDRLTTKNTLAHEHFSFLAGCEISKELFIVELKFNTFEY